MSDRKSQLEERVDRILSYEKFGGSYADQRDQAIELACLAHTLSLMPLDGGKTEDA